VWETGAGVESVVPKFGKNFSGKYHLKFGHFVNFSVKYLVKFEHLLIFIHIFWQKYLRQSRLRSYAYVCPNFCGMRPFGVECSVEIHRSVSVSAPNVDKWTLSADIRFRPKAVVPHSVHFWFRHAAVGKFGGCRK